MMNKELRRVVDNFIKEMEVINKKRIDEAQKEANFCFQECTSFNHLRQKIFEIDKEEFEKRIADSGVLPKNK